VQIGNTMLVYDASIHEAHLQSTAIWMMPSVFSQSSGIGPYVLGSRHSTRGLA
jgi:hypothetical protein